MELSITGWIRYLVARLMRAHHLSAAALALVVAGIACIPSFPPCDCSKGVFPDFEQLDRTVIRSFLGELHKDGRSRATAARKLAALRTFLKYLKREEIITSEYQASLMYLFDAMPCTVVNRVKASTSNDSKLYQEALVSSFGFLTPRTLVTTSSEEAVSFYEACNKKIIYNCSDICREHF